MRGSHGYGESNEAGKELLDLLQAVRPQYATFGFIRKPAVIRPGSIQNPSSSNA